MSLLTQMLDTHEHCQTHSLDANRHKNAVQAIATRESSHVHFVGLVIPGTCRSDVSDTSQVVAVPHLQQTKLASRRLSDIPFRFA